MDPNSPDPDRRPSRFEWERWERAALERGLDRKLASLGRAVMREAGQHGWDLGLRGECGLCDGGAAMLELALRDPGGAAGRWRHLLETDGLRGIRDGETGRWIEWV